MTNNTSQLDTCIENLSTVCLDLNNFSWIQSEGLQEFLHRIVQDYQAHEVHLTTAIIYMDRIHRLSPDLLPDLRALIVISFVVSLKFWEDKVHSNRHYADVAGVTLQELNSWERSVLTLFDYDFQISQAEYKLYAAALGISDSQVKTMNTITETTNAELAPEIEHENLDEFLWGVVNNTPDCDISFPSPLAVKSFTPTSSCIGAKPDVESIDNSGKLMLVKSLFTQTPGIMCDSQSCVKMVATCVASIFSTFFLPPNDNLPEKIVVRKEINTSLRVV